MKQGKLFAVQIPIDAISIDHYNITADHGEKTNEDSTPCCAQNAAHQRTDNMSSIPVIDISPLVRLSERRAGDEDEDEPSSPDDAASVGSVVDRIARACRTCGFFAVTNHGVEDGVVASAWDASKGFFDADRAVKTSCPMKEDYPYGYETHESLGTELSAASNLRPDSKETFSIGPRDGEASGMPPRKWPRGAPSSFAPALARYFDVMEHLASVLFLGLAMALGLDDSSWFLREGRFDDGNQCALRILNYPHLRYDEGEGSGEVHIRAGAHTDYGAMTILRSGGPGLQLRLSSGATGATNGATGAEDDAAWVDVPHLPDAFIINLGDLMQRWTNVRSRMGLCVSHTMRSIS